MDQVVRCIKPNPTPYHHKHARPDDRVLTLNEQSESVAGDAAAASVVSTVFVCDALYDQCVVNVRLDVQPVAGIRAVDTLSTWVKPSNKILIFNCTGNASRNAHGWVDEYAFHRNVQDRSCKSCIRVNHIEHSLVFNARGHGLVTRIANSILGEPGEGRSAERKLGREDPPPPPSATPPPPPP